MPYVAARQCVGVLNTQWREAANFRPPARQRLARQIADDLRRRIVTGDLAVALRLPSVKRLAAIYGVSTGTVQSAIHVLEALGFVRVYHGVGVRIVNPKWDAAVLNHAWLNASVYELAWMRSLIDERTPVEVARAVATGPRIRNPRLLTMIRYHSGERSLARIGTPHGLVGADRRFHAAIARSVRGAEATAGFHDRVVARLEHRLLAVAEIHADDAALDGWHERLAVAVLDGSVAEAQRLARWIARRERESLIDGLR